jgi:glycosyltransferase involved in cell wall biosynthesis
MDYAAMGLAVLASDVAAYRGSLADGPAGQLLPNDPSAWLEAMAWLIRDQDRWRNLASQARAAFLGQASLKSQAAFRRGILSALLDAELPAEA